MPKVYRIETHSPRQTKKAARKILHKLLARGRHPLVLALEGELGSGKTTFIQGLAEALGIKEKILSPTFVLMKVFSLRREPFRNFVHLDAYRIEKPQETKGLGIREVLHDPHNLVVIEWADRIKKLIPRGARWVKFSHGRKPNERVITINE